MIITLSFGIVSYDVLSPFYVAGSVLCTHYLIKLSATLGNKCLYLHFIDEEIESQKGKESKTCSRSQD